MGTLCYTAAQSLSGKSLVSSRFIIAGSRWSVLRTTFFVASVPLFFSQQLQLSGDQIKYLCEEASRAGTQGQRAEIFACEVARASAGEFWTSHQLHVVYANYVSPGMISYVPVCAVAMDTEIFNAILDIA